MSVFIEESGMNFGPFEETDLFQIEESAVYKSLRKHEIKTVEFILHKGDTKAENSEIIFIEAKSSSPRPNNQDNFEIYNRPVECKIEAVPCYKRS